MFMKTHSLNSWFFNDAAMRLWRVVGGGDTGGLRVRRGCPLDSEPLEERLHRGAVVGEVQVGSCRRVFLFVQWT